MIFTNVKLYYDFKIFNNVLTLYHYLTNARAHQEEGENSPGIERDIAPNTWYSCQIFYGRKENQPVPCALANAGAHEEERTSSQRKGY